MKYWTVWQLKQTGDRKRNRDMINIQRKEIILTFIHTQEHLDATSFFKSAYVKFMRNLIVTLILTKEEI